MDRDLIERYAAGGALLRASVEGLGREDLLARPGPGDWSIEEVVIHLSDSDAVSIDRMKRILAEDGPTLLNYNESAYARELAYDDQSIDDALLLFEVGRRQFARVLRTLPDAAFDRAGTHSVRGRVTVGGLVPDYIEHLEYHLKFIRAKRERLGKAIATA
ncbi:MAG: DinB family protein [Isosphaeraceae bacterium]